MTEQFISSSSSSPFGYFPGCLEKMLEDESFDSHSLVVVESDEEHSIGSHQSWSPIIKPRRRFNQQENNYLESIFVEDMNPSVERLQAIADTIGTTRRIITTWFQNHRAKNKRKPNNKHLQTHQKTHIYSSQEKSKKKNKKKKAQKSRKEKEIQASSDYLSPPIPTSPQLHMNQSTQEGLQHYHHHHHHQAYHGDFTATASNANNITTLVAAADENHISCPLSYFDMGSMATTIHQPNNFYMNEVVMPSSSSSSSASSSSSSNYDVSTNGITTADLINAYQCLPQCCLDEVLTGWPCPYHSFYFV